MFAALALTAVIAKPAPAAILPRATVAPPAVATPHAAPSGRVSITWEVRRTTCEQCGKAAVVAMGVKEKFRRATVAPDGSARGDLGTTSALVLPFPHADGVVCVTVTAGWDQAETVRLNAAIREHMTTDPAPADAKTEYGGGTDQASRAPHLWVEGGVHHAAPLLRFFPQAAGIAMEKQGIAAGQVANGLAMGSGPSRLAVLYCLPGPNGLTCQLGAVVASCDAALAKRTAAALSASVTKIMFE